MSDESFKSELVKPVVPETNKIYEDDGTVTYIDRIYGDIFGGDKLILKDGTKYEGKIEKKSIKREDGTLGYVHFANGKWFNRCGLPIEKPKNLLSKSI
jgi:hypothetical protein